MLAVLFALTAFIYASVGFGGGSSYLAFLALFEVDYLLIPIIALICNIVVVSGNIWNYARAGEVDLKFVLPIALTSVPCAFVAGLLEVDKQTFLMVLFCVLVFSALRLLFESQRYHEKQKIKKPLPRGVSAILGAGIGFVSGLVGIGGGILLSPLMFNLRAARARQIAATASVFILLNSLAGLAGHVNKKWPDQTLLEYWYLPVLVFIGGLSANYISARFIPSHIVAFLTALLVLFVAGRIGILIWT